MFLFYASFLDFYFFFFCIIFIFVSVFVSVFWVYYCCLMKQDGYCSFSITHVCSCFEMCTLLFELYILQFTFFFTFLLVDVSIFILIDYRRVLHRYLDQNDNNCSSSFTVIMHKTSYKQLQSVLL